MGELVPIMVFLLITVTLPTAVGSYLKQRHEWELHWVLLLTPVAVIILVSVLTGIPVESWHPHGKEGVFLDVVHKFTRGFGFPFVASVLLGIGVGIGLADLQK